LWSQLHSSKRSFHEAIQGVIKRKNVVTAFATHSVQ
jgi:hypothetical protein